MSIAGQVQNFASDRELEKWSLATKTASSISVKDNAMNALGQGHVLYDWFLEDCFSRVKTAIGDDKIKLIFSMFLNEITPWGIHTDSYHTSKFPDRKSAISCLIPISIDNDPLLCNKSHTIIFNEANRDYVPCSMTSKTWDYSNMPDTTDLPNSAVNIYDKHLSHNKPEVVKRLTVQGEYQWARGSLIWWDSLNFHDSDNFLANGITSKQALVLHTYYD
jgi:hypothetical protein